MHQVAAVLFVYPQDVFLFPPKESVLNVENSLFDECRKGMKGELPVYLHNQEVKTVWQISPTTDIRPQTSIDS